MPNLEAIETRSLGSQAIAEITNLAQKMPVITRSEISETAEVGIREPRYITCVAAARHFLGTTVNEQNIAALTVELRAIAIESRYFPVAREAIIRTMLTSHDGSIKQIRAAEVSAVIDWDMQESRDCLSSVRGSDYTSALLNLTTTTETALKVDLFDKNETPQIAEKIIRKLNLDLFPSFEVAEAGLSLIQTSAEKGLIGNGGLEIKEVVDFIANLGENDSAHGNSCLLTLASLDHRVVKHILETDLKLETSVLNLLERKLKTLITADQLQEEDFEMLSEVAELLPAKNSKTANLLLNNILELYTNVERIEKEDSGVMPSATVYFEATKLYLEKFENGSAEAETGVVDAKTVSRYLEIVSSNGLSGLTDSELIKYFRVKLNPLLNKLIRRANDQTFLDALSNLTLGAREIAVRFLSTYKPNILFIQQENEEPVWYQLIKAQSSNVESQARMLNRIMEVTSGEKMFEVVKKLGKEFPGLAISALTDRYIINNRYIIEAPTSDVELVLNQIIKSSPWIIIKHSSELAERFPHVNFVQGALETIKGEFIKSGIGISGDGLSVLEKFSSPEIYHNFMVWAWSTPNILNRINITYKDLAFFKTCSGTELLHIMNFRLDQGKNIPSQLEDALVAVLVREKDFVNLIDLGGDGTIENSQLVVSGLLEIARLEITRHKKLDRKKLRLGDINKIVNMWVGQIDKKGNKKIWLTALDWDQRKIAKKLQKKNWLNKRTRVKLEQLLAG